MSGLAAGSAEVNLIDPSQIKTFRDFLSNYNRVSEMCFKACIWDFTTRSIKDQEGRCTNACVEKFLKTNQRVSQRFQEIQLTANEHLVQTVNAMQQNQ